MTNDEKLELAFYKHAADEMFPMLKSSALSVTILGDPDPKLCLELGAAILFDKPIILVVPSDRTIPVNIRRVASAIIQGDMNTPGIQEKLQQAITDVMANDARVRPS